MEKAGTLLSAGSAEVPVAEVGWNLQSGEGSKEPGQRLRVAPEQPDGVRGWGSRDVWWYHSTQPYSFQGGQI